MRLERDSRESKRRQRLSCHLDWDEKLEQERPPASLHEGWPNLSANPGPEVRSLQQNNLGPARETSSQHSTVDFQPLTVTVPEPV